MAQKHRYDRGLNGAVAAVIRGERAMADITIQQLADRAGVNSQTLRRYLATERAFDIETLDDVAVALGLSAAAVMARAEERVAAGQSGPSGPDGPDGPGRDPAERDEDAYSAVRRNRALGAALDRKASGKPTRPQDESTESQRSDSGAGNRRSRRA